MIGIAAVAASLLSGCAGLGPAGTAADGRKLTWFSYVNGEDLKDQCTRDVPDRYRMIYNAPSRAQLRTYEVRGEADNRGNGTHGGALVEARAIPAADLVRRDPEDALQPEESEITRVRLSADQFERLTLRLAATGIFDGIPTGPSFGSNGIFWLVSGCHDGAYFVTAFSNPAERFENVGKLDPDL